MIDKLPYIWTYNGRDYPLAQTDLDIELQFQRKHELWLRHRLEAKKSALGQSSYSEDLEIYHQHCAENRFAFGSPTSFRFLISPDGMFHYLTLKFLKAKTFAGESEALDFLRSLAKEVLTELVDYVLGKDFPNAVAPEAS